MENKITNFTQIKEIIEPIPADQFCINRYEDEENRCCFIGHINKHLIGTAFPWTDAGFYGQGARQLTAQFLKETHGLEWASGVDVNNSPDVNGYTEPEIKDRLMHMIEDAIAAGY